MTNKCLVSKLMGTVNANFPKVGELVINVKSGSFGARAFMGKSFIIRAEDNVLSLTNGGPFLKEVTIGDNEGGNAVTVYVSQDATLYCSGKYSDIARLQGDKIIGEVDLSYSSLDRFGIETSMPKVDSITLTPSLTRLYVSCNNIILPYNFANSALQVLQIDSFVDYVEGITTDIVSANFPSLQTLSVPWGSLSGDVRKLGKCGSLTNLIGGQYSGDLEGLVAGFCAFSNKTTGSVYVGYASEHAKYKDTFLRPITSTLQWSPSGNNISITFNSESTIIHVNIDGTWTRVS